MSVSRESEVFIQAGDESRDRLLQLIENVKGYAIFMLDPKGRITSWNAGAERLKGYSSEEIIGKHFSCFYPDEAIAQGKPERELRQAIESGSIEDEGWRIRKDGSRFWANVVITTLFDREGRLSGFGKITRDLTERREIEDLQRVDRLKDEFLALVSHELRNPLAAIDGALNVMALQAASPSDVAEAREIAQRQVRQMARLLNDLLDLARIRQGKMDLRRDLVDVVKVIDRAIDACRPSIQGRRHQLTVLKSTQPLWINGDAARIEQVITNLLTNAIKYTEARGEIRINAEEARTGVVVRIQDSGIGIDRKALPHIFDPFVQVVHHGDRSERGLGLGLTLVKRIVELHEGKVEAFSAGFGRGSEFVVWLPRA